MEQALDALPELDDLAPLREALLDASRQDAGEAWAGSRAYTTVGRRLADPAAVEARIPEIAERLRERTERILTHVVSSLRAVEGGDFLAAARELVAAGELEEGAWRLEEARRYYGKALELGRKPRDRKGEGLALRRLARVARTSGDLPEALRLYRTSYEVSEAARDEAGEVLGCLGVGNVYVDQGEWRKAREWYLRGVERRGVGASAEFLHLCNALSVVERRLGRFDAAEEWLRRGEAEAERTADAAARVYLRHGRAKLHLARGEAAEAERVLREMLEGETDAVARISALINLADPLQMQGRLDDAEDVLREAEALALQLRAVRLLPHVYEQLGKLAGARGDAEGFLFFEQALDLIREHRLPVAQHATLQHAYGAFEAGLGSADAALARFRIARDQFRSIGAAVEARAVAADMKALNDRIAAGEISAAEAGPHDVQ
jgi:tetratricopeptide (TPR) repeat protein